MNKFSRNQGRYLALWSTVVLLLSACGGGGGDSGGSSGGSSGGGTPAPTTILVSAVIASGAGSIAPPSARVVAGQSASFTLTPADGFEVGTVSGCDGTLVEQRYQTGAITAPCTVSVNFNLKRYTVTATVNGVGGTVTPATQTVTHGTATTLAIVAEPDYEVVEATGCSGVLAGSGRERTYQIATVLQNCAVTVRFSKSVIALTTRVTSNTEQLTSGQITNITALNGSAVNLTGNIARVARATVVRMTVVPASGFELTTIQGCQGTLTGNVFTTAALQDDCTVSAIFHRDTEVVFVNSALDTAVRTALTLGSSEPILKTRLAQLTSLQVNNQRVDNLTGLQYAVNLTRLVLNNNQIRDLTPLRGLTKLTTLDLRQNPLSDISALASLNLSSLDISNTAVSDLSALQSMPLVGLSMSDTQVTSLAALQNVRGLRSVFANNTPLQDISVLQQAGQLTTLSLFNTRVSRLESLLQSGLASANARLWISGCVDRKGFSRADAVINQLRLAGASSTYGFTERDDCPDTLGGSQFTAELFTDSEILGVRWQISNAPDNGAWSCQIHLDLQTDVPRQPWRIINGCEQIQQRLLDLSTLRNSYQVSVLFDNGLGGERLVRLPASQSTGNPPFLAGLDFGQVVMKSNPLLIPAREALLRLHVVAANSPAVLPQVTVEATGINVPQTFTATAPQSLPVTANYQTLTQSYQVLLPATVMQTGLQLRVRVNGELIRTVTPQFASQNKLSLLLVPLSLTTATGTVTATLPEVTVLANQIKAIWPLAEVDVRTRAPFLLKQNAQTNTAYTMLSELDDLRAAENSRVYYYGYFKREMGDGCCGGLGYKPGFSAVGVDTDTSGMTMVHELGHNLNLGHIDCGAAPNSDRRYPYNTNSIGSVGVDLALTNLRLPTAFRDVMSYCSPKHVSDYHFEKAQDYLMQNPPIQFAAAATQQANVAAQSERALYVSGNITANGQIEIRTVLPVNRAAQQHPASPISFMVTDAQGQQQQVYPLTPEYGHPAALPFDQMQQQPFQFEIPLQEIAQLELWQGGSLSHRLDFRAQALRTAMPKAQVTERSNEVCVTWPARTGLMLSLLHHVDGLPTAMALNEDSGQFCRAIDALPPGGDWQLVWRQGLFFEEQWLVR